MQDVETKGILNMQQFINEESQKMGETVGEQMASGKVPFMITKKMRAQLKEQAGLSEESIRKLTP